MRLKNFLFFFLLIYTTTSESKENPHLNYFNNALSSVQKNSLLFHSWAIYSQFGEEGILDEVLRRLRVNEGVFIEFSIFYDQYISNTRFLAEREWRGKFIDVSTEFLDDDKKNNQNFKPLPPILCLEEILYFKDIQHLTQVQFIKKPMPKDSTMFFDQVSHEFFPNEEIDVLSIDIGGLDYLMLEKLQHKPKVIIIKCGLCWTPFLATSIPDEIALTGLNQPLPVILDKIEKTVYSPICYTGNLFLIRNDFLFLFEDIKRDSAVLWFDSWNYFAEKRPSYIEWIIKTRNSSSIIQKLDPY